MDPAARLTVNLSVLRRHDNTIQEILDSSSHVCVYKFNGAQGAWTKKGVEGTMFVFKRSKSPSYGFFILNRLGIDNYSTSLTEGLEIQLTEEYIIYRTEDDDIHGIWLYETNDRERIGKKMVELRETAKDTLATPTSLPLITPPIAITTTTTSADPTVATDATTQPQYGKSIDILSLFKQASAPLPPSSTGAQQDAPRDVDPTAVPAPPRDDRPTDLLNKLFAKASINGLAPLPVPTPSTSTGPLVDPQNPMYIVPGPTIPQPPKPSSSSTTSSSHNHQPQPTPKSVVEGRSLLALLQHSDTTAPSSIPHPPLAPPFASSASPLPSTRIFPPAYPLRVSSPFPQQQPQFAMQAPPPFSPRGPNPSQQQPQPAMLYGPISPRVGPQQGFPILTPTLGGAPPLLPAQAFDVARGEMGRRFGGGAKVMSKPEFIQQFLNLVQNDPTFIDALYNNYAVQARTQPPIGPSPLPPVMGMGVNMGMGGPPPTASVSSQHKQHPAGGFYLGGQIL